MNILLVDGLPEDYNGIPLSADFRNMIQVDLITYEEDAGEYEKVIASLNQLYPEIPKDIRMAMDGLAWFYSRGSTPEEITERRAEEPPDKAYSFNQDANLIYSAFYSTYGINLATVEFLHWWEFMALFEGLPETTLIQRVMYWRTVDLKDVSKSERNYIEKMKKLFALNNHNSNRQHMSVEELNQQTKDRVARRHKEAQAALEAQQAKGKEAIDGI